jgi:hypothetical protein
VAVAAIADNAQATVSWDPSADGGSAITGYTVTASPGGKTANTDASTTTATVTGLTNGTAYTFTVTASNDVGTSVASTPSPAVIPPAPMLGNLLANPGFELGQTLWLATPNVINQWSPSQPARSGTWSAWLCGFGSSHSDSISQRVKIPASTRATLSYYVHIDTAEPAELGARDSMHIYVGSTTLQTFSNLDAAAGYQMRTVNLSAYAGQTISLSFTGIENSSNRTSFVVDDAEVTLSSQTAPDAPTGVSVTAGDAQADVSWTAPSNDGGPSITGYTVTASPGGQTATTTGTTTATVTGLTNATAYTFTVTATNAAGTSAASSTSAAVTPKTVPTPPTSLIATASNHEALLSWDAPSSDGGSALTGYTVTATPGGKSVTTTSGTIATITGLTNGTAYTFSVTANNAAGASVASAHSNAITPAGMPDAPGNTVAVAGNRQATITWTASANNGSPVTGYIVTTTPVGGSVVVVGAARTATITGLSNGISYRFSVAATNTVGSGPVALATAVTPTDPTAPTVAITSKPTVLTNSSSASFTFSGTDGSDAVSSLRYFCSLDGVAATSCVSPQTYTGLSSAAHTFTVKVTDPSGNTRTATYAWRVDRVAPTVAMTAPITLYALTTSLSPAWSTKDVGGGLANVDVRWQRAAWNGGFAAAVYPATWQKTTGTKTLLSGVSPAYTYCFSARARDKAGNVSAWSAPKCSAVALDDRSLVAGTGWARTSSSDFYRSTATVTTRSDVTLTRTAVQANGIYLVATRCPTCGTVGVYWNGALIKKVSLYSSTTTRRSVIGITTFTSVRTGTLTIRTLTSNKTVQIDGVALFRT